MFTGIIEEVGILRGIKKGPQSAVLKIEARKVIDDTTNLGDSIAVNGVCLTVTNIEKGCFTADVMNETLERTLLGSLKSGDPVNLERAMLAGGRFGGHIVSGHVDGIGTIVSKKKVDNAFLYTIETSEKIMEYIIEKGSITIDGISLTIVSRNSHEFVVSVIPHTMEQTVLKYKKENDKVNLENDIIGKYVKQFLCPNEQSEKKSSDIGLGFLAEHGYL